VSGLKSNPYVRTARLVWTWTPAIVWMIVIFTFSTQPARPAAGVGGFQMSDKEEHIAAYGLLCLLFFRGFWTCVAEVPGQGFWSFLGAAAYGAIDEFHQRFIPGRECDILDWLADVLGAAIAAFAAIFVMSLLRRGKRNWQKNRALK
jgi:VanZ family protein